MALLKDCLKVSTLSDSDINLYFALAKQYESQKRGTKIKDDSEISLESFIDAAQDEVDNTLNTLNSVAKQYEINPRQLKVQKDALQEMSTAQESDQESYQETIKAQIDQDPNVQTINEKTETEQASSSIPKVKHTKTERATIISEGRNLADKVLKNVNNLDIIIVNTPEDLNAYSGLRDMYFDQNGQPTKAMKSAGGYFVNKTSLHLPGDKSVIVMFADQAASLETFLDDIYHEVVGHYGVREILGPEFWTKFMLKTLNTNRKATQAAFKLKNRWAVHYLAQDTSGNYTLTKNGKPFTVRIPTKGYTQIAANTYADTSTMINYMDEYIAELAKKYRTPEKQLEVEEIDPLTNKEKSFIKRVITLVRHKLRALFGGKYQDLAKNVTDEDIAGLLSQSYMSYIKGQPLTLAEDKARTTLPIANQQFEQGTVPVSLPEDNITVENLNESVNNIKVEDEFVDQAIKKAEVQNVLVANWRKATETFKNTFRRVTHFSGMSTVYSREQMNMLQRRAIGDTNIINRTSAALSKILFKPLEKVGKIDVLDNLVKLWKDGTILNLKTDENNKLTVASYNTLPSEITKEVSYLQMSLLKKWNDMLTVNQDWLTEHKYLPDTEYTQSKYGTYLPRMYKDKLDSYRGSGWSPGPMHWRMGIKKEELIAGENELTDPETLLLQSVMQIGHDAAKLSLFEQMMSVSQEYKKGWVLGQGEKRKTILETTPFYMSDSEDLGDGTTLVNKTYAGYSRLRDKIEDSLRVAEQGRVPGTEQLKMQNNIKKIEEVLTELEAKMIEEAGISPEEFQSNYVYVDPTKYKNLGKLRGTRVYKEIWNELFGSQSSEGFTGASAFVSDMLGTEQGKIVEKTNGVWKAFKTVWNVPAYWVRAFLGTAMMVDMATDTNSFTLSKYFASELNDMFHQDKAKKYKGKTLMEWGIRYGAGGTSLGEGELYQLIRNVKAKTKTASLKAYLKEQNEGTAKWRHVKNFGIMLASDKIASITETLSNHNANMDLAFKLTLMRDYLNDYEKTHKGTNASINKLTEEQFSYLMEKAAEYSAKGVPEYNINIPGLIQTARRSPLGAPFLTFNYKLAGMTADAVLNRPQKFIKYPVSAWAITSMMLAHSGMDEDEYEEAIKNMPFWTKGKSALLPLPYKDKTGQLEVMDATYLIPSVFYLDMTKNLINPLPGETRAGSAFRVATQDFGLFGGILPQLITASKGNVDPFTGREIVTEGMSLAEKGEAWSKYVWNLSTIPVLSSSGVFGDMLNQINDPLNQYGKDKQALYADLISAMGINLKSYRPEEERIAKIRRYNFLENQIKLNRTKKIRDRNLSAEEKAKASMDAAKEIKKLRQERFEDLK